MGMFDTVEVHRKLPIKANDEVSAKEIRALKQGIDWKEVEFQTKSLDDCMEHYKIAVNGKLYIKRQKYKEAKPKKNRSKNKKLFDNLPLLEPDGKPWFEAAPKIPTSLIFYTHIKDYWLEFEAIFLQGKLHEIKQIILENIEEREVVELSPQPKPLRIKNVKARNFLQKFIRWQEKLLLG